MAAAVAAAEATAAMALAAPATQTQTLSLSPDSPRWELEGNAKVTDSLGRKCLLLDGGAATVNDFELRDGIVDGTLRRPRASSSAFSSDRGGRQRRGRSTCGARIRLPRRDQYAGLHVQLADLQRSGFTAGVDIPRTPAFHVRLEVTGAQRSSSSRTWRKPRS
jgi:hypothetical protein